MKRILITGFMLLLLVAGVTGQTPEKKQFKATRITVAPVINGLLDEAEWKTGNWVDDFTQHEPYNGRKASQRTEFTVLFDEDNLYVAIKAFDTAPDSIVNRLTRRDQVDGDLVGIILDSFHDLRTGFLFGVSSSGVKFDQMFTDDGQNEDSSWDPNWWVKTSINGEGWIAEMKIPFSQVRFEKNSGDTWGLEIARIFYRKNETSFWQHIPKDAPGLVHLFGELTGLEQIKPRKIFDITPYGVAKTETFKTVPENPFLAKGKLSALNGGIDAKIGVTNNMTMDLTINPDFGQVEADPSEVNLSAYETFFREKRPFFIEGNNITNFGLGIGDGGVGNDNLFYSRRIGRQPQGYPNLNDGWNADVPTNTTILGAAKLTGKTKNGLSIGFVEAMTAEEKAEIDTVGGRTYQTVEPLTNYMVGRIQKDIKEGNTIIGGIFTSTNRDLDANLSDYMHKAAYTGGVDFTQYFKEKSWMVNLNTAFSLVEGSKNVILNTQRSSARYFQRPDNNHTLLDTNRTSLAGSGGRLQIMKLNGHWNFMSATIWKTPGFETNDLGYIREADQVLSVLWAGYSQWEPKGIYRRYNLNADFYSVNNFGGDWTGGGFEWNASMGLKNYWNIWTGGNFNTSSLSTGMLRGGPMMRMPGSTNARLGFSTDNRKKLVLEVYTNGSRGRENSSRNFNTGVDISYKPTNYLVLTVSPGYSKSYSDLQYVSRVSVNGRDKYIFASIDRKTINTSFRVNLNLSPNLTFQYWGQPFVATGSYYDHKFIIQPMAEKYTDRFWTYSPGQIKLNGDSYDIDENIDGTKEYSFGKRDFNVQEFLSNLVVRWEYNPGSSVYLVWSQTRSSYNSSGNLDLMNDLGDLFDGDDNKPHNVFLIKFSYRFGLK
ncbi:MAG: carbohydrate binding family 9 domain-containing protein [Bacteroidales bacterium]|nr:carbohydrate binding family 9 domain-containing protein [Bacteroidales bacterium]